MIVDGHYYSVPSGLAHGRVDVFTTATLVSLFQRGERVASHPRSPVKGGHSTALEHLPPGHRAVAARTPERMRAEAAAIGVATATYVDRLLAARRHVEQGVRAAHGVVRLAGRHGAAALEQACERALAAGVLAPRFVEGLLQAMPRPVLPEAASTVVPASTATCAAPATTTEGHHAAPDHREAARAQAGGDGGRAAGADAGSRTSRRSASRSAWRSWSTSSTRPPRTPRSGSG